MADATKSAAKPASWLARLVGSPVFPGLLLLAAAALALVAANSPWADRYQELWQTTLTLRLGELQLQKPVLHWINDGLMVVFFFSVGLELKHEFLDGQLRSLRQAALPIAAAIGGMVAPAVIYLTVALAHGDMAVRHGWGIPMATDIAFALGVLALLGPRVPVALRVFLATLAIVDDLGAVLVIALFYTEAIAWHWLLLGLLVVATSYALNRLGVRRTWPYAVAGVLIWLLFLQSGVHATIAGVALAATVPVRRRLDERVFSARGRALLAQFDQVADPTPRTNAAQLAVVHELERHCTDVQAPLQRMEHALAPVVAHAIMPLFALANAGVDLRGGLGDALQHPAACGALLGLLVGKPLGVLLATWLGARLLGAGPPDGVSWRQLHGAAWLAGIGFTMALFVNGLAFPGHPAAHAAAKVAVLLASAVAGLTGFALLRWPAAEAN